MRIGYNGKPLIPAYCPRCRKLTYYVDTLGEDGPEFYSIPCEDCDKQIKKDYHAFLESGLSESEALSRAYARVT